MINVLDILNQKRKNLDGVEYNLFDSTNRQQEMQFIAECLQSYCDNIVELYPGVDKEKILAHIATTFDRINAIRVDPTDSHIPPIKFIVDEFTKNGTIPFSAKKHDGVTMAKKRDGILLLLPDLRCEMQENLEKGTNKTSGRQTLVHEFVHACSVWEMLQKDGSQEYRTGLGFKGSYGLYDDLNEGLTEYYTAQVMRKMYPEAEIEQRYNYRVEAITRIMSGLSREEQAKMFENYITGNSVQIFNYLAEFRDEQGQDLMHFIGELEHQGKGISSANNQQDFDTKEELIKGLSKFKRPDEQPQTEPTKPQDSQDSDPCM